MRDLDELLAFWQRRATELHDIAAYMGFSADGIQAASRASATRICISELRAVAGMLAPLPGQVLDDQTIDAIDHRYAELEERVEALEHVSRVTKNED